ncbi:MAG: helix-turn-helix domain-containing protein [Fibrobacterota bacterium]
MEKLYKPSEVARICNVTTPTIHNWIKKGVLKVVSFPYGRKKISKENLESFLKESGMESIKFE